MTKRRSAHAVDPGVEVKPVPGFGGFYSVTNDGQVWSHQRTLTCSNGLVRSAGNKWLKRNLINKGYYYVNLARGNGNERWLVHRLVALAWIENDNPLRDEVNHKDGVRTNCHVSNLEWCTRSENIRHGWRSRKPTPAQLESSSKNGKKSRAFTNTQILEIRALFGNGVCQRSIAKQFNVTPGAIHKIAHRNSYSEI